MESTKRKQTMSVLNQLRRPAARHASDARFRNEFTGEELPPEEEAAQEEFETQRAKRTEQGLLNKADMSAPMAEVYGAVGSGMRPGPTGMSPDGMTPLTSEEFERRSSFSRVRKPEKKGEAVTKRKKKQDEEEGSDEPVFVNAEY